MLQQPAATGHPLAPWAGTDGGRLFTILSPTVWGMAAMALHTDNASHVLALIEGRPLGNHDLMTASSFATGALKMVQSDAPIFYPNCSDYTSTIGH